MAEQFRLKPTETVTAMQVVGDDRNADDSSPPEGMVAVAEWIGSQVTVGHDRRYELAVPAGRNGFNYARPGEWVVKQGGTFTIVPDDDFQRLYVTAGQGGA